MPNSITQNIIDEFVESITYKYIVTHLDNKARQEFIRLVITDKTNLAYDLVRDKIPEFDTLLSREIETSLQEQYQLAVNTVNLNFSTN